VKADAQQVIIVRGAQQGLDLAARLLLDPGDVVWLEDPGYPIAREILRGVAAEIANIPTDGDGIDVAEGKRQALNARLAYVAPSHQFPLGSTLSLRRRLDLLNWAAEKGAWILEDDYDSEFRYDGQPLTALQGLDAARRVVYIGTFSKTVFPAIRLGYLVVPPELVDAFTAARRSIDHMATSVEQLALAEFLASGQFARHVRQMRTIYRARHDVLLEAAATELEGVLRIEPARTGMHVIGWLPQDFDDQSVAAAAFEAGLEAPALSTFCTERVLPPALVLGFAAIDEKTIRSAVTRLAQVLERTTRRTDAA
jgi:GntR family transcriptional regulator/MocR family aminotransferase